MGHDAYDEAVKTRNYNPPSIGWMPAHPANVDDESCEGYRPDPSHGATACLHNPQGQPAEGSAAPSCSTAAENDK